jgi:carbon monoxide dehydrogenase subunit G
MAMIEARADVTVPVSQKEAFAAITDLEHADWLPGVRGLKHIAGPKLGVGARYDVEAGFVGRHMRGVLVCEEAEEPKRAVMSLEEGLDLRITLTVKPVSGGCNVELTAHYSVGGPFSGAVERATAGAARREVARAMEQFAARFGRKAAAKATGTTSPRKARAAAAGAAGRGSTAAPAKAKAKAKEPARSRRSG